MKTTENKLCVIFEDRSHVGMGCGGSLSATNPTTVASDRHVVWGVTLDGVIAVSLGGGRSEHTVKVVDNFWAYRGDSSTIKTIEVHYADGRSKTLAGW